MVMMMLMMIKMLRRGWWREYVCIVRLGVMSEFGRGRKKKG